MSRKKRVSSVPEGGVRLLRARKHRRSACLRLRACVYMGRRHTAFLKKSPMPSFAFSRKNGFIAAMRGVRGRSISALYGLAAKRQAKKARLRSPGVGRAARRAFASVAPGLAGAREGACVLRLWDRRLMALPWEGRAHAGLFGMLPALLSFPPLFSEEPKMKEIGAQMLARRGQKDRRRRRGCALPAWEGLRGGRLLRRLRGWWAREGTCVLRLWSVGLWLCRGEAGRMRVFSACCPHCFHFPRYSVKSRK